MSERRATRLRVLIKRRDEERSQFGYLRELSGLRMTVTADRAYHSGTRVLVEVPEPPPGFFLEGEVERSLRVPQTLRKVREPMMVIRVLRPEELLSVISPELRFRPYVISKDAPPPAAESAAEATSEEDAEVIEAEAEDEAFQEGVYPVRFPNAKEFHRAVEQIADGVLVVATPIPVPMGSQIEIQIEILGAPLRPIRLEAQVIQHLPPSEKHPSGGMAAVFLKPNVAMARLRAMAANL